MRSRQGGQGESVCRSFPFFPWLPANGFPAIMERAKAVRKEQLEEGSVSPRGERTVGKRYLRRGFPTRGLSLPLAANHVRRRLRLLDHLIGAGGINGPTTLGQPLGNVAQLGLPLTRVGLLRRHLGEFTTEQD